MMFNKDMNENKIIWVLVGMTLTNILFACGFFIEHATVIWK